MTEPLLDPCLSLPSHQSAQLALKNLLMEVSLQAICWFGSVPAFYVRVCPSIFPQQHCCQHQSWAFIVVGIGVIKATEGAELEPGQAVSPQTLVFI